MNIKRDLVVVVLALLASAIYTASAAAAYSHQYDREFRVAGKKTRMDGKLLKAIAVHESCIRNDVPCGTGRGNRLYPYCNPWGYCGIMQVADRSGKYIRNPQGNILMGAREFSSCLHANHNNVIEALVCYNAGQGRVKQLHSHSLQGLLMCFTYPHYGRQCGLVPDWTCPGVNCVQAYVRNISFTYQQLGGLRAVQDTSDAPAKDRHTKHKKYPPSPALQGLVILNKGKGGNNSGLVLAIIAFIVGIVFIRKSREVIT